MGSFKEEYDKRLRRICDITDDTLKVVEDSETVYGGYCETCSYEEDVIVVKVYRDNVVIKRRQFYDMGELVRAMDEVTL